MQAYLARRLLLTLFILLCISIFIFISIRAIPGDIVQVLLGPDATKETVTALRKSMGLDRPLYIQYFTWLVHVLQGDLGDSLRTSRPVLGEILYRFPVTLELTVLSMIMSLTLAIPMGVVGAVKQNNWFDHLLRPISIFGLSVPSFWWGVLFIILLSRYLPEFYSSGYVGIFENFRENIKAMIPPAIALGIAMAAVVTRFVRSSLVEILQEDYVRTARAKGLTELITVGKHALRNAFINVLTIIGLQFGSLLSGAVLVEFVFSLPGVGRLALDAVLQRDYPMVQGTVIFIAFTFVMVNLVVDLLYGVLDPRIRVSR